ncbi:MAG: hypothetical protein ABSB89_05660 [Candidatus Bathyarchaeia archaeon]
MVSEGATRRLAVSVNFIGLTIAKSVFTVQATCYEETNVNAVRP